MVISLGGGAWQDINTFIHIYSKVLHVRIFFVFICSKEESNRSDLVIVPIVTIMESLVAPSTERCLCRISFIAVVQNLFWWLLN